MTSGINVKSCHAPTPVFSSCIHLLGSTTKQRLVLLLALTSLAGNLASLVIRHCSREKRVKTTNDVTGMLVSHLSVSNGVMGVYLAMLVVADQLQGGKYLWRERAWTSSAWCRVAGFLFLLSSQVSVCIVSVASLERCWILSRLHGNVNTKKVSTLLSFVSWIAGFTLAAVPATQTSASSTGPCIPSLVLVPGQQRVHPYVIGVLVVLNGTLMLLTVCGQVCIYAISCRNEMALIFNREGSKDLIMALRMMPISVTDACAWFLVTVLTLLTSHGILMSGDVSFTGTVLAMVTKSSLNPFLYLLSVYLERRQLKHQQRLIQLLRK